MPVRDDHQELLIVKGVAAAKGDSTSSELGLTSISLLAEEGMTGWSLESEGGWSPNLPALKGGGLFADSAVGTGRTLVAAEDMNVIETMQLTVTGDNILDLSARIMALGRIRDAVLEFWINPRSIEPVYLHWWAKGAPGAQYALIYTLDIAIREPDVWQEPIRDVTITIERAPYWPGLPPGTNPKVWTHTIIRGIQTYSTSDLNLTTTGAASDVNHAFAGTVTNNDLSPNNNYLEIAANNIPGDAPALLEIALALESTTPCTYHIAVREEPFNFPNFTGSGFISTLDANNATLGTDAATAADATVASGSRVNITPGTAADSLRLTFAVSVPVYQGRFALFLRAYQNGGAAGDWLAHLEINAADTFFAGIPVITLPEKQFTVGATSWPMVYMGEAEFPIGIPAAAGIIGDGLVKTSYTVLLYARRTTGTSTLRFADLVFVPLDAGYIKVEANFDTSKSSDLIYDNTGYFAHGKPGGYAAPYLRAVSYQSGVAEHAGPLLTLIPGKINRIYFYRDCTDGNPTTTFVVRGNIIPRWRNIRDV